MSARRRLTATLVGTSLLTASLAGAATASPPAPSPGAPAAASPSAAVTAVVVQAGDSAAAAAAVDRLGGRVTRTLPIIGGVAAEVADVAALRGQPGVWPSPRTPP